MHYVQDGWQGNHDTHETRYFQRIYSSLGVGPDWVICDPFARNCELGGEFTNDLNPDMKANNSMDGLEYLQTLDSGRFDLVILDPPFSDVANDRIYDHEKLHGEKSNIYTDATYFKGIMMEIFRILKPGGACLRFGYTSSSLCKGLTTEDIWLINFYSPRKDVIVTRYLKSNLTLHDF